MKRSSKGGLFLYWYFSTTYFQEVIFTKQTAGTFQEVPKRVARKSPERSQVCE
jgi:hypothetical protein